MWICENHSTIQMIKSIDHPCIQVLQRNIGNPNHAAIFFSKTNRVL